MLYFYHDGKEQKGPYAIDELIKAGIKKDTKIWHEGLDDWKSAGEMEEFRTYFNSTPPPFKSEMQATVPPPVKPVNPSAQKPQPAQATTKKSNYSGAIIAFAVIGVLATAAFFYSQYNQAHGGNNSNSDNKYDHFSNEPAPGAETYEEKKMSLAEQEAEYPTNFLTANGTYRETLIGTKFALEIDVTSTATIAKYKDINIEFIFYTRTGTEIDRASYTFYEFVKPGRTTHISTKIDRPAAARQLKFEIKGALSN